MAERRRGDRGRRWIGVVAAAGLVATGCVRASVTRGAPPPAAPAVTVAADTGAAAFVNPPGTPAVSGALHTLYALQYVDVRVGTGAPLVSRQCVYAHYTGWLPDGTKFDSSRDTLPNGETRPPISFPQGARRVIAGWDVGFEGMLVGGQRRLVIPFPLAYGEAGRPPVIPPRATLVFDVELVAARDTLPRADADAIMPPQCAPWSEVSGTGSGGAW